MKKQRKIVTAILILIFSFAFYWFQYRPSKIRQSCSWIEKHSDAVPAKPIMTEDELWANEMLKECKGDVENPYINSFCKVTAKRNEELIEQYKNVQPEIPEKNWSERASEKEYQFCIRSKGINR